MTDTRYPTTDPTMEAISDAVVRGRDGDPESASRDLLALWRDVELADDPFHRCTLAHYLADLYDDPAEALIWDVRALDAANALSDERAQQYYDGLKVAGFYPSLYLNIAENLRRLGSFDAAAEYIHHADQHTDALSDDAYGNSVRTAIHELREAIHNRDTARRASAPGTGG